MAEEKAKVELKAEEKNEPKATPKKASKVDAFVARKLKVINEMPDGLKKKKTAERVLRNKGVK